MITILAGAAVIFLTLFIAAYLASLYHNGYWKRRGIAGPVPIPFSGNMNDWFTEMPMVFKLREWTKKYGKVYGIQEGYTNIMVTSDANMLNELFNKKFEYFHGRKTVPFAGNLDTVKRIHVFNARGARWKRLRAIANPVFSVNNLKKVLPIMYDSTRVMMEYFQEASERQTSIDITDHFHELSMDVIMRIAMGQRESRQFRNVEHVQNITYIFGTAGKTPFHYYGWVAPPSLRFLAHYATRVYDRLTHSPFVEFVDFIEEQVRRRKEQRVNRGDQQEIEESKIVDFIDLFLDAECDSSEIANISNKKTFDKSTEKVSKKLTEAEIAGQCFVFLAAGFDTTANALSITCHYLARHLDAQERLREEIFSVCGDDENPSYEQLNQLPYADAVMKEALRLCPIAGAVCARTCSKTTTLGDYTIEEGTIVQADVFTLQHDKTVWGADALEFRPERWLETGEQKTRAKLNWMPFGAGPRTCIGMRLAYLEEKLALTALLRKYAVRCTPDSEESLDLSGNFILSPTRVTVALEKLE